MSYVYTLTHNVQLNLFNIGCYLNRNVLGIPRLYVSSNVAAGHCSFFTMIYRPIRNWIKDIVQVYSLYVDTIFLHNFIRLMGIIFLPDICVIRICWKDSILRCNKLTNNNYLPFQPRHLLLAQSLLSLFQPSFLSFESFFV